MKKQPRWTKQSKNACSTMLNRRPTNNICTDAHLTAAQTQLMQLTVAVTHNWCSCKLQLLTNDAVVSGTDAQLVRLSVVWTHNWCSCQYYRRTIYAVVSSVVAKLTVTKNCSSWGVVWLGFAMLTFPDCRLEPTKSRTPAVLSKNWRQREQVWTNLLLCCRDDKKFSWTFFLT